MEIEILLKLMYFTDITVSTGIVNRMISQENCQYPSISQESTQQESKGNRPKEIEFKQQYFQAENGYSHKTDPKMHLVLFLLFQCNNMYFKT